MNYFANGVYTHGLRLAFIVCFFSLASKYGIVVTIFTVLAALIVGGLIGIIVKTKPVR